jgi:outer membrane immunogenic protein
LNNQWSIAPHINWFFNKNRNGISTRWKAFNVDGHYYLEAKNFWTIYPIAGINLATVSEKVNDITYSNFDIGINLGVGSEYSIDTNISGFGEIKYVISNADQVVIALGVLFKIKN